MSVANVRVLIVVSIGVVLLFIGTAITSPSYLLTDEVKTTKDRRPRLFTSRVFPSACE